jgi:hypothetical protein
MALDPFQGYSQIIWLKVANVDKITALYGHHTEIRAREQRTNISKGLGVF